MSAARRLAREERGVTMIVAVLLCSVLGIVALNIYNLVTDESNRSKDAAQRQASFEAAEAGIDDYLTKLLSDPTYYYHDVAAGEATRRGSTSGTTVAASATAPSAWTPGDTSWTYPNGKDVWRTLGNGYEYNLEITPPSGSLPYTQIVSTGEKTGATTDTRIVQAWVRPSSVTDFQMIAGADITYGSAATTNGYVYAGIDSNGVAHNVTHNGTATANVYAEGHVYGTTTLTNGAQKYDSTTTPSIRTKISSALNFNNFLTSLTAVQRASQSGGVYLNNTSIAAWKLVFSANGTFTAQQCTGGANPAGTAPSCGGTTTYSIPSNGAVYSPQTVLVSGTVKGRVTVASNNDIVVTDNLLTNDGHCTNQSITASDAIGLVAYNNVWVASYVPYNMTWCGASIAETGVWASYTNDGSHGSFTYVGSSTTSNGGSMSLFQSRTYNYDTALLYLPPPWFPSITQAFTTVLFRELPAP